jgi:hypothetical protein|tara:strand:+ start:241 stop:441 length:201 start_codon:yes stop_codon:yes gene_type:complete
MRIAMKSILTDNITTRNIPVTHHQIFRWRSGVSIQDAMPHLDADDREFIKTGITPEEWDKYCGEVK